MKNKNFRKSVVMILAICMCLSMAGCGSKNKSDDDSTKKKTTTNEYGLTDEELEALQKDFMENNNGESTASGDGTSGKSVTEINPFDNLTVTFEGKAPYATVKLTAQGAKTAVKFTADKTEELSNGDVITVTAELSNEKDADSYKLTETTKTYTVEGLLSYAMKLEDISDDTFEKMKADFEDKIEAHAAKTWIRKASENGYSASVSEECLGYYFLSLKEGYDSRSVNMLYLVYKVDAHTQGAKKGTEGKEQIEGDEFYYKFMRYKDITYLPDGTNSFDLTNGETEQSGGSTKYFEGEMGYYHNLFSAYYYYGYSDLDSMFNDCVACSIDKYNYENTVQE